MPAVTEHAVKVRLSECRSALRQLVGSRRWSQALEYIAEMWSQQVQPDEACYGSALAACAKVPRPVEALTLLRDMQRLGLADTLSYNAAMSACSRGRRWKDALGLVLEMQEQDVQLDVVSMNTAISACGKGEQWQLALQIIYTAKEYHLDPNDITCGAAVTTCEKASQWQRALIVLYDACIFGVDPNIVVYSAAIGSCKRAHAWSHAVALLVDASLKHLAIDSIAFNSTMFACQRASKWEAALRLYSDMQQQKLEPDLATFTTIIHSHGKGQHWRNVLGVLEKVRIDGHTMDAKMRIAAMDALNNSPLWFECLRILSGMRCSSADRQRKSHATGGIDIDRLDTSHEEKAGSASKAEASTSRHLKNERVSDPVAEVLTQGGSAGLYVAFAYGRSARCCITSILHGMSHDSQLIFVPGDCAAAAVAQKLAASDHRLIIRFSSLARIAHVLPEDKPLAGALVDLSMASLPSCAASWLLRVSRNELTHVFREHGELVDPLLWSRLASIIVSHRGAHPLSNNSHLVSSIKAAVDLLDDPAGPSSRLAIDAIRVHLNQENTQMATGLMGLLEFLSIHRRCVVVSARRGASIALNKIVRSLEDCDPSLVGGWPVDKIFQLFPLLLSDSQAWCVKEVSGSTAMDILPSTSARAVQARVLEKLHRRQHSWGPAPQLFPSELFQQPAVEPIFMGKPYSFLADEK